MSDHRPRNSLNGGLAWLLPPGVVALVAAGTWSHSIEAVGAVMIGLAALIALMRREQLAVTILLVAITFNSAVLPLLLRLGLDHHAVQLASLWKEGILVACLLAIVARGRSGWRPDLIDGVGGAFMLLGLAYLVVPGLLVHPPGGNPSLYNRALGWRSDVSPVAAFLVLRHLGLSGRQVDRLLRWVVAAITLVAVLGIFQALFPGAWNDFAVHVIGVNHYREVVLGEQPGPLFDPTTVNTYGSVGGHPILRVGSVLFDDLAAGFVLAIGLGLAAELTARGGARRWVIATLPVIGAALLLTQTRSAIIAGAIGLVLATRHRAGGSPAARVRFARSLAVCLAIALPVAMAAGAFNRFSEDTSADHIHARGAHDAADLLLHHPLGTGLSSANGGGYLVAERAGGITKTLVVSSSSTEVVNSLEITESQYLEIAKELGILGVVLYATLLVLVVVRLWRSSGAHASPSALAAVGAGVTIGLITIEAFVYFEVSTLFWGLFGLALGVADKQQARGRSKDPGLPCRRPTRADDRGVMQRRRILSIMRLRAALLAVLFVAGLLGGFLGSSHTAHYRATAELVVGTAPTNIDPTVQAGQILLAATLAQEIPTASVVNQAVEANGIHRSRSQALRETHATLASGSQLIRVIVTDRNAAVAQQLANAVATTFVDIARKVGPLVSEPNGATGAPAQTSAAPVSLAVPAARPTSAVSNDLGRDLVIGGLAGLLVAILIVAARDLSGPPARSVRQIEERFDLPVVGVVPVHLEPAAVRGG